MPADSFRMMADSQIMFWLSNTGQPDLGSGHAPVYIFQKSKPTKKPAKRNKKSV
jgi:hypothetical protein